MRRFTIPVIVALSIISLIALVWVQIIWANNLINLQNQQFNHKVKMALTNAGYELRLIQHESINTTHPVKQIDNNSFVVEIQDIVNPTQIDSILQKEFEKHEIDFPYKIAIYDCFTDSVVHTQSGTFLQERFAADDYGIDWDINSYNFGVVFPKTKLYLQNFKLWLIAIGVIILITLILGFAVFVIYKQKQLDEMKNDFINNMTHELKTPISTIALGAQVLNQDTIINQPERLKKYAQIILDENNRLKNQVERVLQIAYYENDKLVLDFVDMQLKNVIDKALEPYKESLQAINAVVEVLGDLDCKIHADQHHITQVFSNLIDNAIKYRQLNNPLKITIVVKELNGKLFVNFTDNGMGIGHDFLPHVFKKFYRVPTGNIHNVKGFGIGLSYVKLMIEQHGGKIDIESEMNKGTSFLITLNTI